MGTYYGFYNRTIYKGTTYTLPQFDYSFFRYFKMDLGYLQPIENDVNNFYVCAIGINFKYFIQKYILKDNEEDLSVKTKSLLRINNQNTSWLILEPGIFVAYDFGNKDTEYGVSLDLVNLKF